MAAADFGALNWHDNHVHGFRIVEGAHGAGELVLDIDHIVEWIEDGTGFEFVVVPATLRFLQVAGLCVRLDYRTPSAGIVPPAIHVIERDACGPAGGYVWRIAFAWPDGEITFESPGFVQKPWGEPVRSRAQWLSPEQRVGRAPFAD